MEGHRESIVTHLSVELGWKLMAKFQQNKLPDRQHVEKSGDQIWRGWGGG